MAARNNYFQNFQNFWVLQLLEEEAVVKEAGAKEADNVETGAEEAATMKLQTWRLHQLCLCLGDR